MKNWRWQLGFFVSAGILVSTLNHGLPTLDARFHYSVEEARYFLSSLTPIDERRHFWGECADLFLFIPAYVALLLRLAHNAKNKMLGNFIALAATADVIETGTILYCLQSGNLAPHYLPEFTTMKWLCLGAFGVLYLAEQKLFFRYLRRR